MKQTLRRTLFEGVNLLMSLLFVIPLGVLVEQLCGLALYRCCLVPCLAGLGFLAGRISLTRPANLSMGLCGAGLAAAVAGALALTHGLGLACWLICLMTGFFSVFFFFSARKAAYTIYAPMTVSGILIHLLVLLICTGMKWPAPVGRFTSIIAICYFLMSLYAFSAGGLRRSVHRGRGDRQVSYPAGVQMGNFLLVTGFILVAAFVSNIYPLFHLFSRGFSVVTRGIVALFTYLAAFFHRPTLPAVSAPEEETVSVADEDNLMAVEPKGEASWITTGVEIFAFVCLVLLALFALYKLLKKLRASGVRMPSFLRNLRDRFAPVTDEDYVDENESLFDMKQMLSDTRSNMAAALKKFRQRPQRLEDFPDDRMKLRFAFQQLLRRLLREDPAAKARTPNELYQADCRGDPALRQLTDYYNQARYADGPLPADAAEVARAALKDTRR